MRAFILPIALLLPAFLQAQDARPINCRFLSFGGSAESASVINRTAKGEEIVCPLPTNGFSKSVVCYAKNNAIDFSSSGKTPAATAIIPAGVKSVLLLFVATPKPPDENTAKSLPWRVFVIDDSPRKFPFGGAYIANLMDKEVRFEIAEHNGLLQADGAQGLAPPKERDDFNMVPLLIEIMQNDKWRTVDETSLRFLPGVRYLILAHEDATTGRPRIKSYQDMVPANGKTKGAR